MPVSIEIDSRELEDLALAFGAVDIDAVVERVIPFAYKMTERLLATYPPPGDWNTPGRRWYERGFGPRWYNKAGQVRGYNTSELLQKSWRTRIVSKTEAEVFTQSPKTGGEVSYVEHVHSYEDQTKVHARHGWHTDKAVAEEVENSPALDRALEAEINRELQRVMG